MTNKPNISCPVCDKPTIFHPDNPFRPFCSARCKLTDLGEWANESRKIPGEAVDPVANEEPEE